MNRIFKRNTILFALCGGLTFSTIVPQSVKMTLKTTQVNKNFFAANNYNSEIDKYVIDDKIFHTYFEMEEYIKKEHPITQFSTVKSIDDHYLNWEGQLTSGIITKPGEKLVQVYKGKQGEAFLNREAALKTYLNSYQEKYFSGTHIFDNLYDAQKYFKNYKVAELELNDVKPQKLFINGGIQQTESEIKDWLRTTVRKGFEYEGQTFSETNYDDFISKMNHLNHDVVDDNVLPVSKTDVASYWLNQETSSKLGYFVGPKYLESNEKINSEIKFETTKNKNLSTLFSGFFIVTAGVMMAKTVSEITTSRNSTDEYIKENFKKFNLNKNVLQEFQDKVTSQPFFEQIKKDLDQKTKNIKDPEFTDFHKMLVTFKNILKAAKVYHIPQVSGANYRKIEQIIKNIIVEILSVQNEMLDKVFEGAAKNKGWKEVFLDETMTFEDIYSLFLNPTAFYNDGGEKGKILQIFKNVTDKIEEVIDGAIEAIDQFGALDDNLSNLKSSIKKISKPNSNASEFKNQINQINDNTDKIFSRGSKKILDNLRIKTARETYFDPVVIYQIFKQVWKMGKMLSFISFNTKEAKIDSKNSIFYFEPTLKFPMVNLLAPTNEKPIVVSKLSESTLNLLLPEDKRGEKMPVYEFNNKYFLKKENAKKDLIDQIYLNPGKYLSIEQTLISTFDQNASLKFQTKKTCLVDCRENHVHTKFDESNNLIETKITNFVNSLFQKNFYESSKEVYGDGLMHHDWLWIV